MGLSVKTLIASPIWDEVPSTPTIVVSQECRPYIVIISYVNKYLATYLSVCLSICLSSTRSNAWCVIAFIRHHLYYVEKLSHMSVSSHITDVCKACANINIYIYVDNKENYWIDIFLFNNHINNLACCSTPHPFAIVLDDCESLFSD